MKTISSCLFLWFLVSLFCPLSGFGAEQAVSVGYGFGVLNEHKSTGRIEGGKNYDFYHLAYLYERPSWKKASLLLEPFAAFINRPYSGADFGLGVLLRYYPFSQRHDGFFFDIGGGGAYTTIGFQEQGTHFLFMLTGGMGVKYKNFFIVDRLRHYSNAGTAVPNRSVNANIISIGTYF